MALTEYLCGRAEVRNYAGSDVFGLLYQNVCYHTNRILGRNLSSKTAGWRLEIKSNNTQVSGWSYGFQQHQWTNEVGCFDVPTKFTLLLQYPIIFIHKPYGLVAAAKKLALDLRSRILLGSSSRNVSVFNDMVTKTVFFNDAVTKTVFSMTPWQKKCF